MECVWYRRTIRMPRAWRNQEVLLHFQAIEYDATVWLDGVEVAFHRGGFTPVTVRIAPGHPEKITVVVRARTLRDRNRPRGKQSDKPENYLCCYTRTSGIWQTVWMEAVNEWHLKRPRITPVPQGFLLELPVTKNRKGGRIQAVVRSRNGKGQKIAQAEVSTDSALVPSLLLNIPREERHLWSPEHPYLYELDVTLCDRQGRVLDQATATAGWRFITIDGTKLMLNGEPFYQRLVLDQGYYPEGIWTAPSDAALIKDIRISRKAGFNGARLHQKVFEERFLYHADRLGYLCWGEFGDWGVDWNPEDRQLAEVYQPGLSLVGQWLEVLKRDYNHPAIIGWCGLNETHNRQVRNETTLSFLDDLTKAVFWAAKNTDRSRPVLDASGYIHRVEETDIYDSHDYGQPEEIRNHLAKAVPPCICDTYGEAQWNRPWLGQPYFLSEIGGIGWPYREGDFSYGPPPKSPEEVLARIKATLEAIREDARVFGFCYTQLTDIYQESNGLFTFDRKPKFSLYDLRRIILRSFPH